MAMRRAGEAESSDNRILSDGEFVSKILHEADSRIQSQFPGIVDSKELHRVICQFCKRNKLTEKEIRSGSR
jgi:hypothetical protein